MAMVQVDLSEYDMLREAKNKAEKRVAELEDEIADLSRSNEDKIAELKATIEEAEAKLREITGVKKSLFSKLFKK